MGVFVGLFCALFCAIAQARDSIAPGDMPRYCQGEAAAAFNQRPGDILTLPVERSGNGYAVYGQYPREGNHVTTFECRFDSDRAFQRVSRTGGGGSGNASGNHSSTQAGNYTKLVGKDRKDSESRMVKLGFVKVHDEAKNGRLYSTWLDRSTSECVDMVAKNGEIKSVTPSTSSKCR